MLIGKKSLNKGRQEDKNKDVQNNQKTSNYMTVPKSDSAAYKTLTCKEYRQRVNKWKKIFHSNGNQKRVGVVILK